MTAVSVVAVFNRRLSLAFNHPLRCIPCQHVGPRYKDEGQDDTDGSTSSTIGWA